MVQLQHRRSHLSRNTIAPLSCCMQVVATPVLMEQLGTQKLAAVSCGDHHTAVLNNAHVALSFGSNEYGALGHSEDRVPPYRVPPRAIRGLGAAKVVQVACGATHTLILTHSGRVYASGSGVRGALGLGNREDRYEATPIPALTGVPIAQVAAGDNYSCAVSAAGFTYSWGLNKSGQLGLPLATHPHAAYSPVRLQAIPELIQLVSCGEAHTMWVSLSGRLYAAGKNTHGQLGLGFSPALEDVSMATSGASTVPTHVVDTPTLVAALSNVRVREVACGARHTIILSSTADVYACGDSGEGQGGITLPLSPSASSPVKSPQGVCSELATPDDVAAADHLYPSHTSDISTDFIRGKGLWAPTKIPGLSNIGIFRVCAAGDHALAVRVTEGSVLSTPPGCLPRGAMAFTDANSLIALGRNAAQSQNFAPLKTAIREVVGHATTLNASCLIHPPMRVYHVKAHPTPGLAPIAARIAAPAPVILSPGSTGSEGVTSSSDLHSTAETVLDLSTEADTSGAARTGTIGISEADGVPTDSVTLPANISSPVEAPSSLSPSHASVGGTPSAAEPADNLQVEGVGSEIKSEHSIASPLPQVDSSSLVVRRTLGLNPGASITAPIPFVSEEPGPCAPPALFLDSSGVDVSGMEAALTTALISYNPDIVAEVARAGSSLLEELEGTVSQLTEPDALRCFIPMFMLPINSKPVVSSALMARLCRAVLLLPQPSRDLIARWVGVDVPPQLFANRFIRPLQAHVSYHLSYVISGRADAIVAAAVAPTKADRTNPATGRSPTPAATNPFTAGTASGAETSTSSVSSARPSTVPITHLQALEYTIRVLRVLYNLNERLASEAQSQLSKAPSAQVQLWRPSAFFGVADSRGTVGGAAWPAPTPILAADGEVEPVAALGALVTHEEFYNASVNELPEAVLQMDYQRWARSGYVRNIEKGLTLCGYPFLMDAGTKRKLLHFEALMQMQAEANNAMARSFFTESPFLVLNVRRGHLMTDTLTQLASQPPNALRKQLRVVFDGEEGIDAGGPRRELFQLLLKDVFDPQSSYGLFVFNDATQESWFNPAALPGSEREYFLVGVLLGLAIYNGITLDVNLPITVYKKLLGLPVGLFDLREANPSLADGLEKVLAYAGEDLEDAFCLTMEASYESFGTTQTVELVPGGKTTSVTPANKYDYVEAYVDWYLNKSISAAFKEFMRGFVTVMSGASVALFRPDELELLVAGTPHLDFVQLEKGTVYEGGYSSSHPTVQAFWRVVHGLTADQQRKLLVFVTGCSKAPVGGLGKVAFKLQRAGPDTDNLPTASVCFHVLLLPEYASEDKLRERLSRAIEECSGFGLK